MFDNMKIYGYRQHWAKISLKLVLKLILGQAGLLARKKDKKVVV
jgi:hypothetical protein